MSDKIQDTKSAANVPEEKQTGARADIVFEACGTFGALHKAETWIRENGYSKGSLCRDEPVGLMRGDYNIAKWKNLSAKERKSFDALLLPVHEFREGGCKIVFLKVVKP